MGRVAARVTDEEREEWETDTEEREGKCVIAYLLTAGLFPATHHILLFSLYSRSYYLHCIDRASTLSHCIIYTQTHVWLPIFQFISQVELSREPDTQPPKKKFSPACVLRIWSECRFMTLTLFLSAYLYALAATTKPTKLVNRRTYSIEWCPCWWKLFSLQ